MKKVKDFLKDNVSEMFLVLGIASIFAGLYLIYPPVALITIGIAFLACSYITLNR